MIPSVVTFSVLGHRINKPLQDSDYPTRTPRKPFGMNPFGAGAVAAGGMLPGEFVAGTPSNLGKIGDAGKSSFAFPPASHLPRVI